jgi:maltose alpha-D-glucosyltransferase / alpha-amylase
MKFFRRLHSGIHPSEEMLHFLNEHTSFDRTPRLLGSMHYDPDEGSPVTIALAETYLQNQGTAWNHALDEIARYYERTSGRKPDAPQSTISEMMQPLDPSDEIRSLIGFHFDEARIIGTRTAELHLALASSEDPAFAPQKMSSQDIQSLQQDFLARARNVFSLLETMPTPHLISFNVLERKLDILHHFENLDVHADYGKRIRIHGDYDLGHLLWAKNDFYIVDFGFVSESPDKKQSPLKDVAGMMRSFSYAANARRASMGATRIDDSDLDSTRVWQNWTQHGFLAAYMETVANSSLLPCSHERAADLLKCFLLDKALSELNYECLHRPEWAWIPAIAILDLMDLQRASLP